MSVTRLPSPPRRVRPRQLLGAWAGVVGLVLLAGACGRGDAQQPGTGGSGGPAQPVTLGPENVARVERVTLATGPTLSGTLKPHRDAALRAEVPGTVLEVRAERGERVRRGQVLARIDAAAARDRLRAARAALRSADNALRVAELDDARTHQLFEAGAISKRDHERATAALSQARASRAEARAGLAAAREQVARSTVRAPFDGTVSERQANTGDVVQPGTPLFTVVDPSELRLDASAPAEDLAQLEPGTAVDFKVTGYGERTFSGKVEFVNPVVDPKSGQVRLYVALPNPRGELLGGLYAQGRVATRTRHALALPQDAVSQAQGGGPSVLRLREGKVERVPVRLGLRDDVAERVEVESGLGEGDVVLRQSAQEVAEGTPVKLAEAPAAVGGSGPREDQPEEPEPR